MQICCTSYGDLPPLKDTAALDRELVELRASFFDPQFEPMLTAKSPGPGLRTSSSRAPTSNFFTSESRRDGSEKGLSRERYPLNFAE